MPQSWVIGEGCVGAWPNLWDPANSGPSLTLRPLSDGTVEVDTDAETVTVTVTTPTALQGQWTISVDDLALGPVALAPPAIAGTIAAGETLTVRPGLWLYDGTGAAPARSYQWSQDGSPIPGETGLDLVLPSGAEGSLFSISETAVDANGGRTATGQLGGQAAFAAISGGFRADALPAFPGVAVLPDDMTFTVEAA